MLMPQPSCPWEYAFRVHYTFVCEPNGQAITVAAHIAVQVFRNVAPLSVVRQVC